MVIDQYDESYQDSENRRGISYFGHHLWWQLDSTFLHFLYVVHLLNEACDFLNQTVILLLLSFTRNVCFEICPGIWREEPALRLNPEEDKLNVPVNVDFNLTSVVLVELVAVLVRWLILNFSQSFPDSWNHLSKQVEKGVDVETLLNCLIV